MASSDARPSLSSDFPWELGVYDAHCHPTDIISSIESVPTMRSKALTVMSTRGQDQHLVAAAADRYGIWEQPHGQSGRISGQIIPCFGWHPWFSYQIYDDSAGNGLDNVDTQKLKLAHYRFALIPQPPDEAFITTMPMPRPLSELIGQTRAYLQKYPLALVGEIGLDKAFRIPEQWTPEEEKARDTSITLGGREGRRLSPYRVNMEHQRKILMAQLRLAGELRRGVSVHGVAAHGYLLRTLEECWTGHKKEVISRRREKREQREPGMNDVIEADKSSPDLEVLSYPPKICLHSYSGPPEALKQYYHPSVPAEIYFSFSSAINMSTPAADKAREVIKEVPRDRILAESDLHIAGEEMDRRLEEICRIICDIKGWDLHDGVKQLGDNWKTFIFSN
jgi:Tat protein secretion system quality control protein TatD with DNase activity